MQAVTGAMGSLIPKLWGLLSAEYKLQTGLKKEVESLARDLETAHAALQEVAQVPPDQLAKTVKLWARDIREASFDMEDVLDTFRVSIEGRNSSEHPNGLLKRLEEKMTELFKKTKARHDIACEIDKIKNRLQEAKDRHAAFTVDSIVAKPSASSSSTTDPRLAAMYREVGDLIGTDKSMADVISMLEDDGFHIKVKIVSIVGAGGLGKTTLAKQTYDKLKPQFGCGAFIPVGQNPNPNKVLRDILIDLDKEEYIHPKYNILDTRQLIDEVKDFIGTKRYFIVIDDIWETHTWENIKWALIGNNSGSKIIITTRNLQVSTGEVYELQPLSSGNSRKLFYTRLFGEDKFPDNQPSEVHKASEKILKKCGGVPLAIITMASFLVGKSRGAWFEVCHSVSFIQDKDTMWILSLSFNDLPPHLRTCLLYLSAFPEDYFIDKDCLIWKWIAEGFVDKKEGMGLLEVGEGYFNDLVNRSMIQAVEIKQIGITYGCRVHDMVLDLLRHVSHEENFFTISDKIVAATSSSGSKVRRLAVQNRTGDYSLKHKKISHVRSFLAFMCPIDEKLFSFTPFKLLRVLDLEDCNRGKNNGPINFQHLGELIHLRYLGLKNTSNTGLPEGMGDLKFLQTLRVQENKLPSSIGRLTQLVCLHLSGPPNGGVIGKLTCLEELEAELDHHKVDDSKRQFVKDLGNLTQLRVLRIAIGKISDSIHSDLLQSLKKLQRIQHLSLQFWVPDDARLRTWSAEVLPQGLRHLVFRWVDMGILQPCFDPSHLVNLSHLYVCMANMDDRALELLGRLPQLRYLKLLTESAVTLANVAADGCFPMLRCCCFPWSTVRFALNGDSNVSFTLWKARSNMAFVSRADEDKERAAPAPAPVMPNLQELYFKVDVESLVRSGGSCDNLGLEYLTSLQQVGVEVERLMPRREYVEKEEAALRRAVEAHPNHPNLQFNPRIMAF